MPTTLLADSTIPAVAARFPLAAALLSAWAHEGFVLGELHLQDALGMDTRRMTPAFGIPSALPTALLAA